MAIIKGMFSRVFWLARWTQLYLYFAGSALAASSETYSVGYLTPDSFRAEMTLNCWKACGRRQRGIADNHQKTHVQEKQRRQAEADEGVCGRKGDRERGSGHHVGCMQE